jgi:hypothetical protein
MTVRIRVSIKLDYRHLFLTHAGPPHQQDGPPYPIDRALFKQNTAFVILVKMHYIAFPDGIT